MFVFRKMDGLLRRTFRPISKDLVRRLEQETEIWKYFLTCPHYLLEILDRHEIEQIAELHSESVLFIIYINNLFIIKYTNKKQYQKEDMVRFNHSFLPLSFSK